MICSPTMTKWAPFWYRVGGGVCCQVLQHQEMELETRLMKRPFGTNPPPKWRYSGHGSVGEGWSLQILCGCGLELCGYKVRGTRDARCKFRNQTKLVHHIQNVFLDNGLIHKFGKHVIDKFHAENATLFNFLPVGWTKRVLKVIKYIVSGSPGLAATKTYVSSFTCTG